MMRLPVARHRPMLVSLELSIMSARGLPIMDKSIASTDAFVEIHFDDQVWKSAVVTSLNPVWQDETMSIESDEGTLVVNALDIRVMDHDTYSANDAIGRIRLDTTFFIALLRNEGVLERTFPLTLPIYDTLLGVRGELSFSLSLHLEPMPSEGAHYIHFVAGQMLPDSLQLVEVMGLVDELILEKDPDYEWLDRIRTPRATNEARLASIRKALRLAALSVANASFKMGANYVLGYRERVDVEGSSSDQLCIRVYGTAVRATPRSAVVPRSRSALRVPVTSLSSVGSVAGCGGVVQARSVYLLDDDYSESVEARKRWWAELRGDLFRQAKSVGCHAVTGYSEQISIHRGVAVLTCCGTAVRLAEPSDDDLTLKEHNRNEDNKHNRSSSRGTSSDRILLPSCASFHASYSPDEQSFPVKNIICAICRKMICPEVYLSTGPCPHPPVVSNHRHYVQASVRKRLAKTDDSEELAIEISRHLETIDTEVYNALWAEAKIVNANGNAVFEIRLTLQFCDDILVVVVTGILVRAAALVKEEVVSPSLTSVLSFPGLQRLRYSDARRFSWGSVRDAIRMRPSQAASIQMRIMNVRPTVSHLHEDNHQPKPRTRLASLVDRVKRRQHEKDFLSHIAFERQLCAQIGIVENAGTPNISSVVGLHPSNANHSQIFGREQTLLGGVFALWSDVFIREESRPLQDATAIDGFVSASIEDSLNVGRSLMQSCGGAGLCSLEISSIHLDVDRDHASSILLVSTDFASRIP